MKTLNATYKGLLTGFLMIIASVILFYGLHYEPKDYNQFVVLGIYVVGLLWSLISLKITTNDSATFKLYFSEGFKTFIVVTLLMVIFTYVFYKLNPQILENVIKQNNFLVAKEANYTPQEIEANTVKLRSIFMPMMIAINTIKYLILGALVSVIGGVMLSQKR